METMFIWSFAAYIAVMIFIGWFVTRKQRGGEQFLLGGRNLPLLLTLGTTVATMVGTGSSMGAVGFAYNNGWAGTLYGLGGAVGILLLAWLFAPIRQLKFMTMSEELAYYVGAKVQIKNLIAVIIFIASIGWLGAHIIGGGMYLAWLMDIDIGWAKVIVALSFTLYVIIGGYTAVVWTDAIQALILFSGFILMALFSIHFIGGWQPMLAAQPLENLSLFATEKIGIIPALSLAAAVMVGVLATPSFRQRIYSGRDVSSIRKSFTYSGILYLFFSFIPAIIGMAAFATSPELNNASFAFPHIALNIMPLWLGALIVIAGISATMSSASSDAIAAVSVVLRDLYYLVRGQMPTPNQVVLLSRIALAMTIALALLLALSSDNIISYITTMIAVLMSGLCSCSILGRFWQRFNWQGAMASLILGSLTAIVVTQIPHWLSFWGNPILPSLMAALLGGIIVSLCTPACGVSQAQALAILSQQREQMEQEQAS
ncbi:sodium:solute symporter family protein [Shewanella sp. Scap07]|uniref:sodium:solute symporter family protein n=1 Tax=Shewanella sp. Scap07 TaxID=2589987 RepID=UPI0015BCA93B|nr:sodium:solute symporter family protein [Shewanella sp. Scap07]QLE87142.1 sodium:solute symporter family protein [Shewanella sp. Scap07]